MWLGGPGREKSKSAGLLGTKCVAQPRFGLTDKT